MSHLPATCYRWMNSDSSWIVVGMRILAWSSSRRLKGTQDNNAYLKTQHFRFNAQMRLFNPMILLCIANKSLCHMSDLAKVGDPPPRKIEIIWGGG